MYLDEVIQDMVKKFKEDVNKKFKKDIKNTSEKDKQNNKPKINGCKCKNNISVKMVVEEKYKPEYANSTDYCMDLKVKIHNEKPNQYDFIVNNNTMLVMEDENTTCLLPNESKVFHTGLKVAIPEGYGMFILPRSSTGFKLNCQLANTVGMIDAGYRDEILIKIHNFGTEPVTLTDGQRVCQIFILPRYTINPQIVEDNEEFRTGDRKGGIGSTGV